MLRHFTPYSSLLTDLYELTMACGYWKSGMDEQEAVFHVIFRRNPFQGGYAVVCGLAAVMDHIENFRFDDEETSYLGTLQGEDGKRLFEEPFLKHLRHLCFTCDVDAIPEGTVVFAHEPLIRVKGPLIQAQLLETILLNFLNFQTLVATKAARICFAAQGDQILEFGLRRAQGPEGALLASRASYIGGCAATSNVLAGKQFGIPVRGTLAHSWIMAFETEEEAFAAYARAMPNNCIFLVDTYDTLNGIRTAVRIGRHLREAGHKLVGIRLDSGDLAYLSIEGRKILDEAGFPEAIIVASSELDEQIIASLKQQGAPIHLWAVGTKLVTAYDQPALDGVYKLSAIRDRAGAWSPRIKLSEQPIKTSNPGSLQVCRFRTAEGFCGDMIYNELAPVPNSRDILDPASPWRSKTMPDHAATEDLLVPVFRNGKRVYESPALEDIQTYARTQLAQFHPGIKRLLNPHEYPVGLDSSLHELKASLIRHAHAAIRSA